MSDASRLAVLRAVLMGLAFSALSVGLLASVAPRAFFDDFPLGGAWVALLPPYNEHLVTDVGGLQLAFGVLFAWTAWRPAPELVVPVSAAWLLSQLLHLVFHLTHLGGFSAVDAIAQTASLAAVVALPVAAIALAHARRLSAERAGLTACRPSADSAAWPSRRGR